MTFPASLIGIVGKKAEYTTPRPQGVVVGYIAHAASIALVRKEKGGGDRYCG